MTNSTDSNEYYGYFGTYRYKIGYTFNYDRGIKFSSLKEMVLHFIRTDHEITIRNEFAIFTINNGVGTIIEIIDSKEVVDLYKKLLILK